MAVTIEVPFRLVSAIWDYCDALARYSLRTRDKLFDCIKEVYSPKAIE